MAEENNTHVVYKAIADFTALTRAARKARRELAELRKEEAKLNAQSVAGSAAAASATGKSTKSREALVTAFEKEAPSVKASTVRFIENSKAVKENSEEVQNLGTKISETNTVSKALNETIAKVAVTHSKFKKEANGTWREVERNGVAMRRNRNEVSRLGQAFNATLRSASQLQRGLDKLDDWRPRLVPPFIALIPLIASVIALINPLIAGLGAVGAAGLGFASSLGRVAAGAIAVIPALATLISMVAALKASFGGIGNAFKAFGAMQKASGGGGGGGGGGAPQKEELTRTEKLQRAQEALARSIEDVRYAQEDLHEARKDYIKRLRELQKAVDRASMSEARAAANSQLARENYMNVMADPGSTKGDKMDAQVSVREAETDLRDTIDQNKENADDLAKMKRDGIKGDRQVVMATRRVTDAIWAQRDAQLALNNALKDAGTAGGGGGAGGAIDEYAAALAKLSPSARRFVEQIVAMKDAWDALKRNVQESFFSEFVDDIYLLRRILPSVESLLSNTAGAVGRVVDRFLKLITSPAWQRDLILIGEQNVPIIENIGDALLAWVDAFKDLTIIAGPFLISLTDGLKEGAKNFRRIVADARSDGSLASYLEDVRERMSQWWRIVKNIGKALFNYSAAAGDFATWITDGFEAVTEGWLKSSEQAREAGSPFQEYLEDIKPLLSGVKGLFADFFGWFARTASDPKNIGGFIDIVDTIRDDLGPALGDLLQTLADTGIGNKLVESITSIIESLDSIIKSGGGAGFVAFFDIITSFFAGLADALKNPILGPVIKTIAVALGTITALSFIGKFTGLTTLFGWLIRLAGTSGVMKLLDKLPGIGALSGGGGGGRHVATGGGRHAAPSVPIGGRGVVAGGAIAAGAIFGGAGIIDSATKVFQSLQTYLDAGGPGAILSGTPEEKEAAIGGLSDATAATMLPPGLRGILSMFAPEALTQVDAFLSDMTNAIFTWAFSLPENLATWVGDLWRGIQGLGPWIEARWQELVIWFQELPYNIGVIAGNIWNGIKGIGEWLGERWVEFTTWLSTLPAKIGIAAGELWSRMKKVGPWLAERWVEFTTWLRGLPGRVGAAAVNLWNNLPKFAGWLNDRLSEIRTWARRLPGQVAGWIGNLFSGVGGWFTTSVNNLVKGFLSTQNGYNGGKILKRAGGGGVPGVRSNSDTVHAMLTPGEFVIRKAIVNRVGEDNLARFNSGVMSYAQLLQSAMANSSPNKRKGDKGGTSSGISFFNGGGIVPSLPPNFGGGGSTPGVPPGFGSGPEGAGGGFYVENLIVNNPVPETTSESLPRTIRKLAYVGTSRGGRK